MITAAPKPLRTDADRFDNERFLMACMGVTLAVINELRSDPLTIKPAITPGAWRQRILEAYQAL